MATTSSMRRNRWTSRSTRASQPVRYELWRRLSTCASSAGVHPGQRELERRDAPPRPSVERRRPGGGRPRGILIVRLERREEELREPDVERLDEAGIGDLLARQLGGDALGHLAVEAGEAGDAVGVRRRGLDRPEATDHTCEGRRSPQAYAVPGRRVARRRGCVRAFLIAGDGIATWPDLCAGWKVFNLNHVQHQASLTRLATLGPLTVGVGHGKPITEDAAGRVQQLAEAY